MTTSRFTRETGIKFHWGGTDLPGYMRFKTNEYSFSGDRTEVFNHHPIASMYGVSFKSIFFIGLTMFSVT